MEAAALSEAEHACCPLCGGANACAAAARGDFAERCWCESVVVDPTLLARVPAGRHACLCATCLAGRSGDER
ncbi:MAG: cysteine-rich CWC family protein [Caldimonas sp.]